MTCLSTDALPGGLWRDIVKAAALATLSDDAEAPRDGPEGAAELRRLADAAEALVERPADPVSAAVFAGMLPDCPLADATAGFIAAAIAAGERRSGLPDAAEGLAAGGAWDRMSTAFLAAPESLREELAFRLAGAFIELGAAEALALIEPHAVSADGAASRRPRRALIEAELAYARGDRAEALGALRDLAGPQHSARQAAAILLAERLQPDGDTPIPAGWLAHLDLVGSIALEAAGGALGERAALAEVRLAEAVLGPAEGLRRLSLAHQRGLVSTPSLERVAALIESGGRLEEPIPLAVLQAYDPGSFASVEARQTDRGAQSAAQVPVYGAAEATPERAPDAAERTREGGGSLPDWRALVSAAGTGALRDPPIQREEGGVAAGSGEIGPTSGVPPGSPPAVRTSLPTAYAPADPSRDALLDDVERFLSITEGDLFRIEELLNDG
ncbi:MAG: hypothetical protein AAFP17_16865 [Pseudomonadota bacterium]